MKKKYFSILLLVLISACSLSEKHKEKDTIKQTSSGTVADTNRVYSIYEVDKKATYLNGEEALLSDIYEAINTELIQHNLSASGTIQLMFTISRLGKAEDIKALGRQDEELKKIVIKALQSLDGNWVPALKSGKIVPMQFMLPILLN